MEDEKKHENQISNKDLTGILNKSIAFLIQDFMKILLCDFSSAKNMIQIALKQKNAAQIRTQYEEKGLHVPPFMIASITGLCNLKCKGCYDKGKCHTGTELDERQWSDIFSQAKALGISFILLAGGEPLLKEKIIKACSRFPEIIFPVFTNGLLINEEWASFFASNRNLIPVISIEGRQPLTDRRRGEGVFDQVCSIMALLAKKNIFYGVSITLTSENYFEALDESFIKSLLVKGCPLFFFIEYVPFDASTKELTLKPAQIEALEKTLENLRKKYKGLFIAFPGDEKEFGGCLAAGRGFIHVSANGAVEACPFAPYSDMNLSEITLKEALSSPMLNKIRGLHGLLEEHQGGCTLFDNKAIVEKALKES